MDMVPLFFLFQYQTYFFVNQSIHFSLTLTSTAIIIDCTTLVFFLHGRVLYMILLIHYRTTNNLAFIKIAWSISLNKT